jgi:outer membrane protease
MADRMQGCLTIYNLNSDTDLSLLKGQLTTMESASLFRMKGLDIKVSSTDWQNNNAMLIKELNTNTEAKFLKGRTCWESSLTNISSAESYMENNRIAAYNIYNDING